MIHFSTLLSADLLFAWGAYFVGTASPGPSNLAIMSLAMRTGRRAALTFTAGVISGSMFWAMLATLGLSAALAAWSEGIVVIRVAGGVYLLWLAFRSARSAWRSGEAFALAQSAESAKTAATARQLYARGLLMHLTNPKSILVWMSIVSLALPATGGGTHALPVVAGCLCIGVTVFTSYALLFSTQRARRVYQGVRRWLDGSLAIMFGVAGIKLLTSRN